MRTGLTLLDNRGLAGHNINSFVPDHDRRLLHLARQEILEAQNPSTKRVRGSLRQAFLTVPEALTHHLQVQMGQYEGIRFVVNHRRNNIFSGIVMSPDTIEDMPDNIPGGKISSLLRRVLGVGWYCSSVHGFGTDDDVYHLCRSETLFADGTPFGRIPSAQLFTLQSM
jgi:hypothetical protein